MITMIEKYSSRLLVQKKRILYIALSLILFCLVLGIETILQNFDASFVTRQSGILFLSIGIYAYIIISAYFLIKRIDFFQIFSVLSFFFFFSRHLLLLFNAVPTGGILFKKVISEESYSMTGFFIIESMLCVYIGYLSIGRKFMDSSKILKTNIDISKTENNALKYAAWILFAITALPYLISSKKAIQDTITYGYGYRINELSKEGATISGIAAGMMLPSLMALYITKKNQSKLPVVLLVIYFLIYTLSGSRLNTFCYLITFFYLYLYWRDTNKKIPWKGLIIIGFIIIFSFSIVSNARGIFSNSQNMNTIIHKAILNVWNDNPITAALYEVGNTFVVTACILEKCPATVPHLNGMSYICNFAYIIPNAWTNNYTDNYVFTDEAFAGFLVPYGGVGSSFVAEAYYNFGRYAFIMLLIIGMMWGWLCDKTESCLLRGNIIKFFFYLEFFVTIIFMVRSDLVYRLRPFVWYSVSLVILAYVISKYTNNIKKGNC